MGSAVKVKEAVKVQVDKWTAVEDLESWRTGLNTLNESWLLERCLDDPHDRCGSVVGAQEASRTDG